MRELHVADFGAVGDGETDDRAAIVAALADAAIHKAAVVFDAKTYRIDEEIRLTIPGGHSSLVGMPYINGSNAVLRAGRAGMRSVLSLMGQHVLRDIFVDANRLARHAIYCQGASLCVFERVSASGAQRDGVFVANRTDGSVPWQPTTVYYHGVRVHNAGNVYECIIAPLDGGPSGSVAPTGTGAAIADGTLYWRYAGPALTWLASTVYAVGALAQNGGNVYECIAVTGARRSAASGGPTGTGQTITDGDLTWRYLNTYVVPGEGQIGFGYAINGNNNWIGCAIGGNGSAWATPELLRGVTDDVTGYTIPAQRTELTAASAEVQSGSRTIRFTGIDLTTFDLRGGDYIRIGMAPKRLRMLLAPPVAAGQLEVDVPLDIAGTGLDFAILSGDGYREVPHGDNNFNHFYGGLGRSNVGAAFAFAGLYGGSLHNIQIDYCGYGVRVGLHGAMGCTSGIVSHCYFEGMHGDKPFKLNAPHDWTIVSPLALGGYRGSIEYGASGPSTVSGVYVAGDHIEPLGIQTKNVINSVVIGNQFEGAHFYGPWRVLSMGAVAGPSVQTPSRVVYLSADAPQTVTRIEKAVAGDWAPVYGDPVSQLVTFMNASAHPITFTASTAINLRTPQVTLQTHEAITFHGGWNDIWFELSRSVAESSLGAPQTMLNVQAVSEDGLASPGDRQPNFLIVSVTDASGAPVSGLAATDFRADAMIVGAGGANVEITRLRAGRLPGFYLLELLPLRTETWKPGVYIFALAVAANGRRGQTITSVLLD